MKRAAPALLLLLLLFLRPRRRLPAAAAAAPPPDLAPRAYKPLPLGTVAPQGWLLEQLVRQANALAGVMATSTFPGADTVNRSLWIGGDGRPRVGAGATQWLPYWTNGVVPLVELIQAAGPDAVARLDPALSLVPVVEQVVDYVLGHTNKTNGWVGPFLNEPGDANGHGLWDPLNMLRTLLNYAEAHPAREREIAAAAVAHLTQEAHLLQTDPVIKWASTRWPTYVEIAQFVYDEYLPKYGDDPAVMPLGKQSTAAMLLASSQLFADKGMNWSSYYHQTGSVKFPEGPVQGWNTNDHGVNNAEGALRWPAAAYRMSGGDPAVRDEMAFALGMLDKWQGQVQSLFCADEVFCGRAPHRGTETCAVVEAMASLEFAYAVFGDAHAGLMDRVERLAFNAMPAALTADMWTHVYVQQANSVFAGRTGPVSAADQHQTPAYWDPSRRHHALHYQHHHDTQVGDTPSGEDQTANFFGVSHFPCCITNFPQGWPKFAQHAYLLANSTTATPPQLVVASLVPAKASFALSASETVDITTDGEYPFSDEVSIRVSSSSSSSGSSVGGGVVLKIRVPGWAVGATVDGRPVKNGTTWSSATPVAPGTTRTFNVALHPHVRAEFGWGDLGVRAGSPVTFTAAAAAAVPTADPAHDLTLSGGASVLGSRQPGFQDLRSGSPGTNASALVLHPIGGTTPDGKGHYITGASIRFRYVAGFTPGAGQPAKTGSQVALVLVDAADPETEVATLAVSPPLDKWSFDNYKGYSPPVTLRADASTTRVKDAPSRLLLAIKIINNDRNLQIQLDPSAGLHATVSWDPTASFPAGPYAPPSEYLSPPRNSVAVLRGPLVFALHPREARKIVMSYASDLPYRPKAVDYEISTSDPWNYALLAGREGEAAAAADWLRFDGAASSGWTTDFAFDDSGEFPFSIVAEARTVPDWGFWSGSKITGNVPPSPYNKTAGLGNVTQLRLVPFGGTNIRGSVFPWIVK